MSTIYRFGDFRLDAAKRTLFSGEGPVSLTPKAFDLLQVLVENRDRVLPKDELLGKVWQDTFVEEGILKYNVSTIRKALGGESWIETLPRRGYRFAGEVVEVEAQVEEKAGLALTMEAEISTETEHASRQWIWAALAILLLCGGVVAMAWFRGSAPNIRSIAVLPLQSTTAGASNREFELGLTDSLIAKLGADGPWLVRPTGAVRHLAGVERDPVEAGRKLDVDAVLDGSIQSSGDRLRLTLQLLRVTDGKHLWTGKFDQKLTDLFTLEDQVTGEIAQALRSKLRVQPSSAEKRNPSQGNPEVYQLYLSGRHYFNDTRQAPTRMAIQKFQEAVTKDPEFAPAYGMLALSYWQLGQRGWASPAQVRTPMIEAATKAIQLDDTNGAGHTAMAFAKMWFEYDWDGARKEFKRAYELNPNEPLVYVAWGIHGISTGNFGETDRAYRRKLEIDPGSIMSIEGMGYVPMYTEQYDEAVRWFRKALEVDPNLPVAYTDLAIVYSIRGMHKEMVEASLKQAALTGTAPEELARRLRVFQDRGIAGYRQDRLDSLLARQKAGQPVPPFALASAYHALGDKERTLDWLEKAVDEHAFQVLYLKTLPQYKDLRSEPRYHALLRKIHLE